MARQGLGQGKNEDPLAQRDEVDDLFDALMDNPAKECRIEEIDPSKRGWEIFLHFQSGDPRIPGTEAHEDFKTFKHFAKLGIASCEYKDGTRTAVLSYLDGCCEDEFSPEHIELMQKYQPRAKAPDAARTPKKAADIQVPVPVSGLTEQQAVCPETVRSAARESASQILVGVTSALSKKPPVIQHFEGPHDPPVVIKFEDQAREVFAVKKPHEELVVPEDIFLEIPQDEQKLARVLRAVGCRDFDELLAIFQRITDEEELLFQHGEPEGESLGMYMVNIYKDPNVRYLKPMDAENMAFIQKLQDAIQSEE